MNICVEVGGLMWKSPVMQRFSLNSFQLFLKHNSLSLYRWYSITFSSFIVDSLLLFVLLLMIFTVVAEVQFSEIRIIAFFFLSMGKLALILVQYLVSQFRLITKCGYISLRVAHISYVVCKPATFCICTYIISLTPPVGMLAGGGGVWKRVKIWKKKERGGRD